MIVKIRMTFEGTDGSSVTADIHSQDGITIHGKIWPADLDLVNAIQRQIIKRRDRYVTRKDKDSKETKRPQLPQGGSSTSPPFGHLNLRPNAPK